MCVGCVCVERETKSVISGRWVIEVFFLQLTFRLFVLSNFSTINIWHLCNKNISVLSPSKHIATQSWKGSTLITFLSVFLMLMPGALIIAISICLINQLPVMRHSGNPVPGHQQVLYIWVWPSYLLRPEGLTWHQTHSEASGAEAANPPTVARRQLSPEVDYGIQRAPSMGRYSRR